MVFTTTEIDKVLNKKSWDIQRKEDELLRMDCKMYTNLGIDSTSEDKLQVKKSSRNIYLAIKKISPKLGDLLLHTR
jgi:hypothetical protein